jgi:hypothetical protein
MKREFKLTGFNVTDTSIEIDLPDYNLQHSILIGATRDGGNTINIEAEDDDIVEFKFDDDSFWMGSIGEIPLLLKNDSEPGSRGFDDGIMEIPSSLSFGQDDRGIIKQLLIKAFNVFKPKGDITGAVVKKSAELLDNKLQPSPGLYYVDSDFNTIKINSTIKETDQPYLLLIHGTASSMHGSFGKMIDNKQPGLWENLKLTYGDRILALEHQTLTKSPFENATDIVKWLPSKVKLHIISTSRGGLVGEVLSKYCDIEKPGFLPEHRELIITDFGKESIELFENEIKTRQIQIEKFIRIACPAAGTTLCSNRLDLFLNVIINGIGMATGGTSTAIMSVCKKLLADVLACKARPDILPGLYSMHPEADFIRVLNHRNETIHGSLHVIAGNNKIGPNLKAFITIITKLFYLGKNDWIVDTKSMSRGLFRKQNIGYFYDEGSEVNHFSYFANADTQQAVNNALAALPDTIAEGFESFDRTLPQNADRGFFMGNLKPKEVSGNKPVIVLIPGILGSNISKDNDEIYLDFWKIAWGKMAELSVDAPNVKATSLIGRFYTKFADAFSDEYDVAVFPFDWRLNLKGEADKLNVYVQKILQKAPGKTIRFVAHSMGGLVLREFISSYKESTWATVSKFEDHKVVFLGSPLGGSYLIPEILVGKGSRLKQLAGLDLLHSKKSLLSVFSRYDGMLSLLPINTKPYDFTKLETWQEMKKNFVSVDWVIPDESAMKKFADFHKSVREFNTDIYKSKNFIYVAGKSDSTVNGFYYSQQSLNQDKLIFTATSKGDGSVTWESGIPNEIKENNRVYYTMVGHGDLANDKSLFGGIREILKTGQTSLLSKTPPISRGESDVFDMPEQLVEDMTQENLENVMMGATLVNKVSKETTSPLQIELKCGDLRYASFPILVGHLKGDGIVSAEKVVDSYLNNVLTRRLATGNYPGNIGECKYFQNPNGKPVGAIIVGMGKSEKLSGFQLEETVKYGVIEYLCSLEKKETNQPTVGISTLLLGCAYAGLSVETAIKAIIAGVHKANESIKNNGPDIWPIVDKVEFVEIFEDRALQALLCLEQFKINPLMGINFEPKLQKLIGGRKRLNFENNSDWWQRVTIQSAYHYDESNKRTHVFTFSSSMGAAREEVRKLYCSRVFIESLMKEISTREQWDGALAKSIFELLIPNDFKMAVRNQQNLLLILDEVTAGYPWEMLQDVSVQALPLATSVGMVRQLSTDEFRPGVNYTMDSRALVIGNPNTEGFLPSLSGAKEEAEMVNNIFKEIGYETVYSNEESSSAIIKKMFSSDYRIMHLAGHGLFNANDPDTSGMVVGPDVFLTTKEIEQLSCVPELVFINCCHLGNTNAMSEAASQNRYKLAANLGTQLIKIGVKVVIAAGWAINDAAAKEFTKDFYEGMLSGLNFGDAIKEARKNCFERYPNSNTWGAYQCYGDQFYTLRKVYRKSKSETKRYFVDEQVKLDIENLINKIGANFSASQKQGYTRELESILLGVEESNISIMPFNELIAIFYNRIGEAEMSMKYFERYFEMNSSAFNMGSYVEYSALKLNYFASQPQGAKEIKKVISQVENLCKVIPSHLLYELLATAHKKLAFMQLGTQRLDSIQKSVDYYQKAFDHGKMSNVDNTMYSISNALMLGILLPKNANPQQGIADLEWAYAHSRTFDNQLTFWDLMDEPNYLLCKFMLQQTGLVFPNGNIKVTREQIVQSIQQVFVLSGEEIRKLDVIKKYQLLFNLYDQVKTKSIHKLLIQILTDIEKLNGE